MIRHTIIEIIIVIVLVFLSIPVWRSFDLEKYASVAMYYDNMGANYLEVSDFSDYVLYQVNDVDAIESIKPINLRLSNTSNSLEDYAIWMTVSKSSTLDTESIKLRIDNEISYLKDKINKDKLILKFIMSLKIISMRLKNIFLMVF